MFVFNLQCRGLLTALRCNAEAPLRMHTALDDQPVTDQLLQCWNPRTMQGSHGGIIYSI
jgi:hypothetical protein